MEQEPEYTLVEHLTELRKRLIIVAVTFIVTLIIGFSLAPKLLTFIKTQPTAAHVEWNVFGYTDGLMIYLSCALVIILTDYITNRIVPNMVICKTRII